MVRYAWWFAWVRSFRLKIVVDIGQRCRGLGHVATAVHLRGCDLWWQRGASYFPCHLRSPVVPRANRSRLRCPCKVRADVGHGRASAVGGMFCWLQSVATGFIVGRL